MVRVKFQVRVKYQGGLKWQIRIEIRVKSQGVVISRAGKMHRNTVYRSISIFCTYTVEKKFELDS